MTPSKTTVFIVDDDPSVRKSLLRLIRSGGWRGEAFASAEEFLALPAFPGTGCLILDVCMPGMMGPELCDVMAARNITLPVIFLTGSAGFPEGIDPWGAGAVGFLVKPVEAEELMHVVRQTLKRHAAGQNDKHRPASLAGFQNEAAQTGVDSGGAAGLCLRAVQC